MMDDTHPRARAHKNMGRVVLCYLGVVDALRSMPAAQLLQQLVFWTPMSKHSGWIYKTQEDLYSEIRISRYDAAKARRILKKHGLVDIKLRGIPPTLHYRVNWDAYETFLAKLPDIDENDVSGEVELEDSTSILKDSKTQKTARRRSKSGLTSIQKCPDIPEMTSKDDVQREIRTRTDKREPEEDTRPSLADARSAAGVFSFSAPRLTSTDTPDSPVLHREGLTWIGQTDLLAERIWQDPVEALVMPKGTLDIGKEDFRRTLTFLLEEQAIYRESKRLPDDGRNLFDFYVEFFRTRFTKLRWEQLGTDYCAWLFRRELGIKGHRSRIQREYMKEVDDLRLLCWRLQDSGSGPMAYIKYLQQASREEDKPITSMKQALSAARFNRYLQTRQTAC